ncbi:MAG: hypothetical protein ACTSRV_11770 [Candidatus Freyarchaeota archaeon]
METKRNEGENLAARLSRALSTRGEIHLEVYCDEIQRTSLRGGPDEGVWMYLGALFVPAPIKNTLINELLNRRCLNHQSWHWSENDCPRQCGRHHWNNTEIHFRDLPGHQSKHRIAENWLNFLMQNNLENRGLVYFNILGINLSKLNLERFGEHRGRDHNIYNRFFRTLISGGAKYFFSEHQHIIIHKIYHDKGGQENHPLFSWYTPYRLNLTDEKIYVANNEILFIDSDHRKYSNKDDVDLRAESQLIQFIDLILGSIHCCLHASATNKEKIKLASIIKPLLERLMENPQNKNSRYNYHRKQQIQFFPKTPLPNFTDTHTKQLSIRGESIELNKLFPSNFYTQRKIRLRDPRNQNICNYLLPKSNKH